MKIVENTRYEYYRNMLEQAPAIQKAVMDTFQENPDLSIDSKLYLMVFAPALIGFTDWVLSEAVREHKDRIYFLSRDGFQMYLIAQQLIRKRKLKIFCSYLHVSRYAVRIPTYHLNIEESFDTICTGGIDVTPLKILKKAALTEEESMEILAELKLTEKKDQILNYSQVLQVKEKLKTSRQIRTYIREHSKVAYEAAAGYFRQEGLTEDNNYFLVDSGWIGTLQQSMELLVQTINPDIRIQGCYFGMYDTPKGMRDDSFRTYYFSKKSGLKRKIHFSNSLFETIVSSEEGMTMGYEKVGDRYEPVFCKNTNPNKKQMFGNIRALRLMSEKLQVDGEVLIQRSTVERLFYGFMSEPSWLEVEVYGNDRFSDDVLEGTLKKVAAELTEEQIRNQRFFHKLLIIARLRKATIYESAWLEGSTARLYEKKPELARREYRHIRLYKAFIFGRKQYSRK